MPTVIEAAEAVWRGERRAADLVDDCFAAIHERDGALDALPEPRTAGW